MSPTTGNIAASEPETDTAENLRRLERALSVPMLSSALERELQRIGLLSFDDDGSTVVTSRILLVQQMKLDITVSMPPRLWQARQCGIVGGPPSEALIDDFIARSVTASIEILMAGRELECEVRVVPDGDSRSPLGHRLQESMIGRIVAPLRLRFRVAPRLVPPPLPERDNIRLPLPETEQRVMGALFVEDGPDRGHVEWAKRHPRCPVPEEVQGDWTGPNCLSDLYESSVDDGEYGAAQVWPAGGRCVVRGVTVRFEAL